MQLSLTFCQHCIAVLSNNKFNNGNFQYNAIAFNVDCYSMESFHEFSVATREWHKTLLNEEEKRFLGNMPVIDKIHFDGKLFLLAHASPQGDIFIYLNKNEIVNEIDDIIGEYILVSHTHRQYKIKFGDNLIVNPGSVGLSRDSGKACYATYENGSIQLNKIDYDVDKTIFDLMKSPIPNYYKEGLKKVLLHEESETIF